MAFIKIPPGWAMPERQATPESVYLSRRDVLKKLGFSALGIAGLCGAYRQLNGPYASAFAGPQDLDSFIPKSPNSGLYPAKRNPVFKLDRPITNEFIAAKYNNFYEFSLKKNVWQHISQFQTRPWSIEIKGEVEKPQTWDIDDLVRKMPLEERLYRHRCVEAWSMAVPWTGFPLKALLEQAMPKSSAKYVRFVTFLNPSVAVEQKKAHWYPWPYFEALTIPEALNELTFVATGIYGHEMTKQHGAPVRIVVPWKYGYKSIKSIVKIELTRKQPATFWNQLQPQEYGFVSNVDPDIPHPRWSQAKETLIDTGEKRPTLKYNGYGEYVARLYS